ncbi:uncharacterized protein LOC130902947 [Diorhabda carinulata]|uniref:uncharacterized protein LOC130902947 n=1 Tax=Diorhabda carinulata TaxID=1163345 RepID=UPI0025A2F21D|nr:uncharacterized protein LOC130902947 [Diorhabda carinulata]
MHGFSDASEDAFGSCIYLRSIDANGEVFTSLLCAKSKAAPLKTVTLPRLELMAAVTLVRLSNEVKRSLRIKIDQCVYWSDSTVVLGWLKHPPNQLKPFVANRVAEIQDLSAADSWRHVPTKSNPADLVSRGVKPRNLLNNSLWWEGPPFLKERKESWPECLNKNENLPDIRKQKVNLLISCSENDFIKHFSDVNKLKRITAYIRCFYLNCKAKGNSELSNSGPLEVSELDGALNCLTKLSQGEFFHRDINKLNKNKPAADCKIISLNLFLDRDGILRVGGRLTNAKFAFEKKHPAILSSKSHLAELLVRNTHLRLMHAGPQHTLVTLRERLWIVGGRTLVKNVVRKCIPCFRYKPTQTQPIMAPLPEMRLKSRHPFEFVGVDYAGPMSIKNKSGRGYKVSKAYICLFVCCVTKAVHTELVSDLSTDAFLLALKRFVSRRGKPACIYSDNGTNFVGANNALKELGRFIINNETNLTNSFQADDITWKFIPPRSPHFGGLWESGIKCIKYHLRRVTKDLSFTFEQLYTILTEVEAILNSQPLSPLSDSSHDLHPLTPSHFLIGRSSNAAPEPNITHLPRNRLSMYQHLAQVKQHLWKRWNKEYVSELQTRTKWKFNYDSLKANTLVLLKEDNQPPMKWKLGRVEAIHLGADGVARVATIRTTDGHVKRSFAKICPLPLDDKE